uniref:Uncharacterized protein n=1 Tax=Oryza brachyantha TaxID=4533 RepID=J3MJ27_ORYBR
MAQVALPGPGSVSCEYGQIPPENRETNRLSLINPSLAHVGYCSIYG